MGCCANSKFVKYIWILLGILLLVVALFLLVSCGKKEGMESHRANMAMEDKGILYYTCGMHPSVRVRPEEYEKGNVNCPICNMKLVPVYKEEKEETAYYGCGMEGQEHVFQIQEIKGMAKCPVCGMPLRKLSKEEADKLRGVAGRIKIRGEQARLAGIRTEPVRKSRLYKTIRTVGRVAYDPRLTVAEEEFISSLKAMDKIKESGIAEIRERAANLVTSARRKLRLLGLSEKQIEELEDKREIHTSLILPEKKMWIYGDVYEYELSWVKEGVKVGVTTTSLPGERFTGIISSLNPVLDPKTRSVKFRAEVDNPGLKLKPEMYVDVIIQSIYMGPDGSHTALAIPKEAVLDTGTRKIIWVDKGNGEYEGRVVDVGPETVATMDGRESKFYPVLKGVAEGERVVTKANFLIDSQSQITGVAAAAYGGALQSDEKKMPTMHRH